MALLALLGMCGITCTLVFIGGETAEPVVFLQEEQIMSLASTFDSRKAQYLVQTEELEALLEDPNLRIINAGLYYDATPYSTHIAERIPGSVLLMIEEWADPTAPVDLPDNEYWSYLMRRIGVGKNDPIIVYDHTDGHQVNACFVAWMFMLYGATDVRILDGGFYKWVSENRTVETGESASTWSYGADWESKDYSYSLGG